MPCKDQTINSGKVHWRICFHWHHLCTPPAPHLLMHAHLCLLPLPEASGVHTHGRKDTQRGRHLRFSLCLHLWRVARSVARRRPPSHPWPSPPAGFWREIICDTLNYALFLCHFAHYSLKRKCSTVSTPARLYSLALVYDFNAKYSATIWISCHYLLIVFISFQQFLNKSINNAYSSVRAQLFLEL